MQTPRAAPLLTVDALLRRALLCVATLTLGACSTTEEQVREQIEILAANEVDSARWNEAVEQLVTVGRPGARQLVALLDPAKYRGVEYREFRDEIEHTRTGAAVVLGRIKHKAASASMDDRVAVAYRYSERLASLRGVGELGFTEAAVTALETQLADVDPVIRLLAAVALVKIGEDTARDTIVRVVVHGDDDLAELAISELEGANYHGVPILVALATGHEARRERLQRALDQVRAQLVAQLDDDDPEVRQESAAALGDVDDPSVVARLLLMLEDASNLVRFNAASSLVRLGNERGTEFLFSALDNEDAVLRLNAIKSLVRVQQLSGRVEVRLVDCLQAESSRLRSGAAQILGQAQVGNAVGQLLAIADDADPEVRWNVVIALGHIGSPASRPTLERLVGDADETVAYYAEWALEQL
jgi:HEAT repeat protein